MVNGDSFCYRPENISDFQLMGKCSCGWGCQLSISMHVPFYSFQSPLKIGVAMGQSSLQQHVSTGNTHHLQAWPKAFLHVLLQALSPLGWLGCPHLGDTGDIPKDSKAAVSLVPKRLGGRAIPKTWTPAQYYLVSKNKTKKRFYWLKPWNYGIWGVSLYHSLA